MNKQSLYVPLTFFYVCIALNEQAYAMKSFAEVFHTTMKSFHYGVLFSLPATIIYIKTNGTYQHEDCQVKRLSTESEQFLLDYIHQGYPELKKHPISIIRTPHVNFAAGWFNGKPYIFVGKKCDDKELNLARQFKRNNFNRFTKKELEQKSKQDNLTIPSYITAGEHQGYAMTAQTLDTWQAILLHEGSHILHHDNTVINNLSLTSPLITLYGCKKLKQHCTINLLPSSPALANMLRGLGYIPSLPLKLLLTYAVYVYPYRYWAEYRADQDTIERATDPKILRALSVHFTHLPEAPPTQLTVGALLKKLLFFYKYDVHPANKKRAAYFAKAAQKLEKEQAHKAASKN